MLREVKQKLPLPPGNLLADFAVKAPGRELTRRFPASAPSSMPASRRRAMKVSTVTVSDDMLFAASAQGFRVAISALDRSAHGSGGGREPGNRGRIEEGL